MEYVKGIRKLVRHRSLILLPEGLTDGYRSYIEPYIIDLTKMLNRSLLTINIEKNEGIMWHLNSRLVQLNHILMRN